MLPSVSSTTFYHSFRGTCESLRWLLPKIFSKSANALIRALTGIFCQAGLPPAHVFLLPVQHDSRVDTGRIELTQRAGTRGHARGWCRWSEFLKWLMPCRSPLGSCRVTGHGYQFWRRSIGLAKSTQSAVIRGSTLVRASQVEANLERRCRERTRRVR